VARRTTTPKRGANTTSRAKSSRAKSSRAKTSRASRAADLTRPTPRAERLIPRTIGRVALLIGALVVIGSFANSFLVLPVQSWFGQRTEIEDRQEELDVLRGATDRLQQEVDRLNTPAGVEDAAREELGFVMVGEDRRTVVGTPQAPLDLPRGWPYDVVDQIVTSRQAEAVIPEP
jgi:cell division protein FtsB